MAAVFVINTPYLTYYGRKAAISVFFPCFPVGYFGAPGKNLDMHHIDKKHQESYLFVEKKAGDNLKLTRHIMDEVQIEPTEEERIDRRYGSNAEIDFSTSLDPSIRESVSVDYPAEKKKQEDFWALLPPYRTQGYDRTRTCINSPDTQLLAIDEHPKVGSPFITYSFNGIKYMIKRMGSKSGRIDDKIPSEEITIDTKAIRTGISNGHPLFLTPKSLYVFTPDLAQHRIAVESPNDLAIPDKFDGNLCVLRALDEVYNPNRPLNFIEEIDLLSGKILTYRVQSPDSNILYEKIIPTWHPKQYICSSRNTIACVDLRVSKGLQIYSRRKGDRSRSGISSVNIETILSISKGPEGKVCALTESKMIIQDMRYFEHPFSRFPHPIYRPAISVGRNIALYNSTGNFHYCSPHDPGNYKYVKYVIPENIRAFSWIGKSNKTPYSVCAFLFMNFLHVHHVSDGDFKTLKCERGPKFVEKRTLEQGLRKCQKSIEKLVEKNPKLTRVLNRAPSAPFQQTDIEANTSLPRPTLLDEITLPKRSMKWHLDRASEDLQKQVMCSNWKEYVIQDAERTPREKKKKEYIDEQ